MILTHAGFLDNHLLQTILKVLQKLTKHKQQFAKSYLMRFVYLSFGNLEC